MTTLEGRKPVLSSNDKLDYVRRAKQAGYFARIFYVCTASPDINASRVARRVMDGGHDVPITKIIQRFCGSLASATAAAAVVDRFYLFDNSVDQQAPRRLFRAPMAAWRESTSRRLTK